MRDKKFPWSLRGRWLESRRSWLTQKMKLKSINRVFMQVIVATVSSRLLILRCDLPSFPLFACDEILPVRGMGYYALLGLTWSTSGARAIDLRIYLRVACVAAPLSTGACALPRENAMAMVGTSLIGTIISCNGNKWTSQTSNESSS